MFSDGFLDCLFVVSLCDYNIVFFCMNCAVREIKLYRLNKNGVLCLFYLYVR